MTSLYFSAGQHTARRAQWCSWVSAAGGSKF